ncbi:MAG: hypothetical protein R3E32_00155 [Chitinophagales bacterium]
MQTSKLLQILKTLHKNEWRLCSKFVRSPYFNEQQKVIELFDYLFEAAPRFAQKRIAKETVFQHLFPNEPYRSIRMRQLMSSLTSLIEEFLRYEEQKKEKENGLLQLAKVYRQRSLTKLFDRCIKDLQLSQQKRISKNADYFFDEWRIYTALKEQIEDQHKRNAEPFLQELSDSLDAFYLIHKLKISYEAINYQRFAPKEYHLNLLKEIQQHLKENPYTHIPAIGIFHQGLNTLIEEGESVHFETLKDLLMKHFKDFDISETQDMFVMAHNYCIRQANKSGGEIDTAFRRLFDLYQFEIENDVFLEDGWLSPFVYKNAVTIGLQLHDYEWVEQFIHQYKERVKKDARERLFTYNLARLYFMKKEFAEVIPLLNRVDYKEVFLELSAKTILLQTYLELGEYPALSAFLDSFSVFIHRKKSLKSRRKPYLNLIKYTRKVISYENQPDKLQKIFEDIQATTFLTEKGWLLEKVRQLL